MELRMTAHHVPCVYHAASPTCPHWLILTTYWQLRDSAALWRQPSLVISLVWKWLGWQGKSELQKKEWSRVSLGYVWKLKWWIKQERLAFYIQVHTQNKAPPWVIVKSMCVGQGAMSQYYLHTKRWHKISLRSLMLQSWTWLQTSIYSFYLCLHFQPI